MLLPRQKRITTWIAVSLAASIALGSLRTGIARADDRTRCVRMRVLNDETLVGKAGNLLATGLLHTRPGAKAIRDGYKAALADPSDEIFFAKFLRKLNIGLKVSDPDLARIPKTGGGVFVSNHPFGFADGIALGAAIGKVRKDVKIMINDVIEFPAFSEHVIPIRVFGSPLQRGRANKKAIAEAEQWLKDGHILVMMGSGELPHVAQGPHGDYLAEGIWKDGASAFTLKTGAPAYPVFIPGNLSDDFMRRRKKNPSLALARLIPEFQKQMGSTVEVRIGEAVSADFLKKVKAPSEELRMRSDLMSVEHKKVARDISKFAPIEKGYSAEQIAHVFEDLKKRMPASQIPARGSNSVFLLNKKDYLAAGGSVENYNILKDEIGRLREVTFRDVGEGTGASRDLDQYDDYYSHIIAWDEKKQQIIGSYRIAFADKVIAEHGVEGLYSHKQFKYGQDFFNRLNGKAIELGRSFVRKEYQGSGLFLLLASIAKTFAKNPEYRVAFGNPSISGEFQQLSIFSMINHLSTHHFDQDLSALIRPEHPVNISSSLDPEKLKILQSRMQDMDGLENVVSVIERGERRVPELIPAYQSMGARFLGFDHDASFNTYDGMIVVDLIDDFRKANPKLMRMFMGKDEYEQYLKHHGVSDSP